jgi:hypothetical protein
MKLKKQLHLQWPEKIKYLGINLAMISEGLGTGNH